MYRESLKGLRKQGVWSGGWIWILLGRVLGWGTAWWQSTYLPFMLGVPGDSKPCKASTSSTIVQDCSLTKRSAFPTCCATKPPDTLPPSSHILSKPLQTPPAVLRFARQSVFTNYMRQISAFYNKRQDPKMNQHQ